MSEDTLISNLLFRSLSVRVATRWLNGEDVTTEGYPRSANMSNGVLPTSGDKQRKSKPPLSIERKKDYKRTKGRLKPKSRRRMKKLRRRGPVKKYEDRARKNPDKIERRPSGGKRDVTEYKKDYDWAEDHKKRKKQKSDWETTPQAKKTRKKNYEKNKNKAK